MERRDILDNTVGSVNILPGTGRVDRFEAMSMLVAVADAGSLTGAARLLRVPLPTLSRRINDLEARLGARLLLRTTRRITFTDAGNAYVAAARRILEQLDDAEREAAGEFLTPKGELVLAAPLHFGRRYVLPVVNDFLARFPDINVRLLLSDRNVDLIDAHVDMAVRIGRLPDSGMVATNIGAMRTVVCASPALFDGHGVPRAPEDLSGLPTVVAETHLLASNWRFRAAQGLGAVDVAVVPRLRVSTTEAAVQAAVAGVGAARLLHYQVADDVRRGALRIVLTEFEPEAIPVSLLHASRGQMPLKMRRFMDFAVPKLRDDLTSMA